MKMRRRPVLVPQRSRERHAEHLVQAVGDRLIEAREQPAVTVHRGRDRGMSEALPDRERVRPWAIASAAAV
jgi:hypothetical protein